MNWKFTCESKQNIPLPPEYTFVQSFNYLNPESNSFFILENENGYIQCGGSKSNCTVELREFLEFGNYRHYVFYNPNGSKERIHFKMTDGGVYREKRHSFNFLKAAKLFLCYFEGRNWPNNIKLEEIKEQFE